MLKAWIENLLKDKFAEQWQQITEYVDQRVKKYIAVTGNEKPQKLPILTYEEVAELSKLREGLTPDARPTRKRAKGAKSGWKQPSHERKGHYRTLKSGEKVWVKGYTVRKD